jgi:hypothetical protein
VWAKCWHQIGLPAPAGAQGLATPLPWPPIPGTAQQPQPASPWRPLTQHGIEPVHNLLCKHLTDPIPASRPGLPVPTICRVASYQPQPLSSRPALSWLSCEPCSGCIEDGFSGAPLCPSIDTRPRGTQLLTSCSALSRWWLHRPRHAASCGSPGAPSSINGGGLFSMRRRGRGAPDRHICCLAKLLSIRGAASASTANAPVQYVEECADFNLFAGHSAVVGVEKTKPV